MGLKCNYRLPYPCVQVRLPNRSATANHRCRHERHKSYLLHCFLFHSIDEMECKKFEWTHHMDRIFKSPFSMTGAISQDRERCQFLFCLMFLFCLIKNPLLYQAARPESGREVRERSFMAPLARTQSERRRRLALASGFRRVRSFGIDRIAAPAHAAGRGSVGPDG